MPRGWFIGLIAGAIALVAGTPAWASSLGGTAVATCLAPVRAGDTPQAMLAARDGFDCATGQARHGSGDYWVRSAPLATAGTAVRVGSLWQRRATLHILYRDGELLTLPPLDGHGATRHLQLGAIVEQSLPPRTAAPARLLWHIEDAANLRGVVLGASLATPAQSQSSNLALAALYAAFGGLCAALLLYNLALWAAMRHRFQLVYCGLVATLLLYALSSSGALAWLAPGIANNDRIRLNYLALGLAGAAALLFARCFFEPRVFGRRLSMIATATMLAVAGSGLAFALFAPWHIALLDRLFAASFVAEMAVAGAVLWQAWRRRSNDLWLFALAWGAPIALACLRIAGNLNLLAWSFLLDNSTLAAMAVEAIASSLAIAYRTRLLSIERDQAREREIAARLLADLDPLTGLLNRRAFLRETIGRDGRHTLLLCDLDHFKRVNDAVGHDGGDEVLRAVAQTLRSVVDHGALVARLGGEEFAILVDERRTPAPAAILDALRAAPMPFGLGVTASIGTSTGPVVTDASWTALYRAADRALFAAKAAGRDRVHAGRLACAA